MQILACGGKRPMLCYRRTAEIRSEWRVLLAQVVGDRKLVPFLFLTQVDSGLFQLDDALPFLIAYPSSSGFTYVTEACLSDPAVCTDACT
jgi:hypothetical protein